MTTYYLHEEKGDDSKSGLSQREAVKTYDHILNILGPGRNKIVEIGSRYLSSPDAWYLIRALNVDKVYPDDSGGGAPARKGVAGVVAEDMRLGDGGLLRQ